MERQDMCYFSSQSCGTQTVVQVLARMPTHLATHIASRVTQPKNQLYCWITESTYFWYVMFPGFLTVTLNSHIPTPCWYMTSQPETRTIRSTNSRWYFELSGLQTAWLHIQLEKEVTSIYVCYNTLIKLQHTVFLDNKGGCKTLFPQIFFMVFWLIGHLLDRYS